MQGQDTGCKTCKTEDEGRVENVYFENLNVGFLASVVLTMIKIIVFMLRIISLQTHIYNDYDTPGKHYNSLLMPLRPFGQCNT